MAEPDALPALDVQVLGDWAVRRAGKMIALQPPVSTLLHALVLSPDPVRRGDLKAILEDTGRSKEQSENALRNSSKSLRKRHHIDVFVQHPMWFPRDQPGLKVDLWELRDLYEVKDYDAAVLKLGTARHLALPHDVPGAHTLFAKALEEFQTILEDLDAYRYKATSRVRATREMRQTLLDGELLAGFEPRITIREIRDRLEPLPLPWSPQRTPKPPPDPLPPLVDSLSETLSDETGPPSRIIVTASPGFGKALCAVSTYIRLTDALDGPDAPNVRTVLFLDGRAELEQPGFASEKWLMERLERVGDRSGRRPIVILSHADAFLSTCGVRLRRTLGEGIFTEADVLLTCNEQFYARTRALKEYIRHELRLIEWDPDHQSRYVSALFGADTLAVYEDWRSEHRTRRVLCEVPVQLHYVVSLAAAADGSLDTVARRWQLFEEVAKARLRASDLESLLTPVMDDLSALAHHFYDAIESSEAAIHFTEEQLSAELEQRSVPDVDTRRQILMHRTVLDAQTQPTDRIRFHDTLWGWFFTARHICRVLISPRVVPDEVLAAFEKFLAASVMDRCEETLADWPGRDVTILPRLREVLAAPNLSGVRGSRRRVAREQAAYLLGVLADEDVNAELRATLDESSPSFERDDLVRRATAIGLSNAGETDVADAYVDELRAEINAGGPVPRADTNIRFVLSFRGDQPLHLGASDPKLADPARTVSELLRGLENDHHPGTWRIKLFTLLDLATRAAPERTQRLLVGHSVRVCAVLDRLAENLSRQSWPEIREMRELLAYLPAEAVAD